jgi:hypothetical protein
MKKMWKRRFRDKGPKYMNVVKRRQYYLTSSVSRSFKQKGEEKRRDIPDFAQIQHGKNRIVERV